MTTNVVRMIVITGKGTAIHKDSATNCDAPAKTSPLIKNDSRILNFAWRASTPKTRPIAKALIAIGIVRLAPSNAPERVNMMFMFLLVVTALSVKLALSISTTSLVVAARLNGSRY